MSREIKFRYWDIINEAMIEDAHLLDSLNEKLARPNEYVLEQFTGLHDKDGKPIYEGDITNYGIIEWCDCLNWDGGGSTHPGFYFKDKYEGYDKGGLSYHYGFDKDIEVIGNIHQNPELIK